MKTTTLFLALGLVAQSTIAFAQGAASAGQGASGQGAADGEPLLAQPRTQNDTAYLCGGVGDREINYMKQQAKDYDLMLTFATREGAYLANVDVDIKDAKGNQVLQVACDAPMLLVDLPRGGTYQVKADAVGYTLNRTVSVGTPRNGRRVASTVLAWPQQVADGGPTGTTSIGTSGDTGGKAGSSRTNSGSGAR